MLKASKNNDYISNGVTISPQVPTTGEKVKIMYDGLLSKNGAHHIYAHIGFGNNWENASDYQMIKSMTGFETEISVLKTDTLNIAFKDCANNWDNNSSKNYTFDVSE